MRISARRARRLRVDTLIWLRWLAVCRPDRRQFLIAYYVLGVQFPVLACFVCIAASVVLNAALRVRFPVSHRLDNSWAINVLAFDIAQLAALLLLTGGLVNPFSFLFLAPIMTSAVSLPLRRTLGLLAFTLACATALQFWRLPLRWPGGDGDSAADALRRRNVDRHRRQRDFHHHLRQPHRRGGAATRQRADRHRAQPRPPAASFASSTGWPPPRRTNWARRWRPWRWWSTNWRPSRRSPPNAPTICVWWRSRSRAAERSCGKLSSPATIAAASLEETTLGELIEEIVAPHRLLDVAIEVESQGTPPEPVCRRNAGLIYGLHQHRRERGQLRRAAGRRSARPGPPPR